MTVALLLPVTFALEPASAFIMFAGIYYGGMYGGSTTSILLNTPGESSSVVTAIEGNKMAKAGPSRPGAGHRRDRLLHRRHHRHRCCSSFCAPVVVTFAVSLGDPSYFAIMVLVAARGHRGAGQLAAARLQRPRARPRHRPGRLDPDRPAAAHLRPAAAGRRHRHRRRRGRASSRSARRCGSPPTCVAPPPHVIPVGRPWMGKRRLEAVLEAVAARHRVRLPVRRAARRRRGDPDVPVLRHREASSRKHPEEFGQGAIEGVAGPEAANNASAAGTLVPMLALGLPTNATAAVMLAAFTQYGIQPGPAAVRRASRSWSGP